MLTIYRAARIRDAVADQDRLKSISFWLVLIVLALAFPFAAFGQAIIQAYSFTFPPNAGSPILGLTLFGLPATFFPSKKFSSTALGRLGVPERRTFAHSNHLLNRADNRRGSAVFWSEASYGLGTNAAGPRPFFCLGTSAMDQARKMMLSQPLL
jgi:hypothetical protein